VTSKDRQDLFKGLAFCSPWIIGLCVFTLLPLILSLYYSFCDYSLLQDPVWIGTQNYRDIAHDELFWQALRNTFAYALVALPMGIIISIAMALLLNQNIKGQSFYRTTIFLPSLVPAVASAMLWMWLFNAKLGLINTVLSAIGVNGQISFDWLNNLLHLQGNDAFKALPLPPAWLNDARTAMSALILMSFWGVGNSVVIYLAGLQDVPRELYEAADIDGASGWQRLWNVTLPMISPVIFFNLIMAIIGSLQTFSTPYIMTGGGPYHATYFYTMYLYDKAYVFLQMGYASAMAWIQLFIVLILTALAFWTSRRWVHYQGK
jgi:multiple sugar transport system permease protein